MTVRVGFDAWGLSGEARHTGMGQYSEQLLTRLPAFGASVVAYGAPDEPAPPWLPPEVAWRTPPALGPGRTAALETRLLALRAAVTEDAVDVFHAPGVHVRPSFPPVPRVCCPVVVTVHDAIPATFYGRSLPLRNRVYWRWNVRWAERADGLVTVSEHARREICAVTGCPPERITVIPNGVSFARRDDRSSLERMGIDAPFVLLAGSFEPRKNLATALDAFDMVAADHPRLTGVALVERTSGHASAASRHRDRLRHGDRVRFVAGLGHRDVEALYSSAAAVVFCSLAEGFGFPAVQAAACGTPLVASDLPVLHEVVGSFPLYVDPRRPASVADGISRALTDPDVKVRAAAEGPGVSAGHDPARWAEAHFNLYRTVRKEDVRAGI